MRISNDKRAFDSTVQFVPPKNKPTNSNRTNVIYVSRDIMGFLCFLIWAHKPANNAEVNSVPPKITEKRRWIETI